MLLQCCLCIRFKHFEYFYYRQPLIMKICVDCFNYVVYKWNKIMYIHDLVNGYTHINRKFRCISLPVEDVRINIPHSTTL